MSRPKLQGEGIMRTVNGGRIAVGLLLAAWCAAAGAFSISLKPSPASYALGVPFALNVVADGLAADGDFLTTYDLDIGFQTGITFVSAASTGALGSSLFLSSPAPGTPGPGTANVFESSFELDSFFTSPPQPDPVTVATLTFVGTSVGPFDFTLSANALGGSQVADPQNPTGPTIARDLLLALDPTLTGASITITPRAAVPEPATPLLIALAFLLLSLPFRRQRR